MTRKLKNIHPGEVLLEEFIKPFDLTAASVARAVGVKPARINEICREERAVTADTALRLAAYFGNSPQFWLSLQSAYDLEEAKGAAGWKIKPLQTGT